jgi:hypothetical protein
MGKHFIDPKFLKLFLAPFFAKTAPCPSWRSLDIPALLKSWQKHFVNQRNWTKLPSPHPTRICKSISFIHDICLNCGYALPWFLWLCTQVPVRIHHYDVFAWRWWKSSFVMTNVTLPGDGISCLESGLRHPLPDLNRPDVNFTAHIKITKPHALFQRPTYHHSPLV